MFPYNIFRGSKTLLKKYGLIYTKLLLQEIFTGTDHAYALMVKKIHGVSYEEMFPPVVSWSMVRILLTLSDIIGLKSRKVEYL